jgi:hypothetical protein
MGFKIQDLHATGTVEFHLTGVATPTPSLTMKFAGDENKPLRNAIAKLASRHAFRNKTAPDINRMLIPLYAKHVVVGWTNVFEDGKPAAFSVEKCEEYLTAIDEAGGIDIISEAFGFANDKYNFRDTPVGSAEDVGKK